MAEPPHNGSNRPDKKERVMAKKKVPQEPCMFCHVNPCVCSDQEPEPEQEGNDDE